MALSKERVNMMSNAIRPIENDVAWGFTQSQPFIGPTMPMVVAEVTHYFSQLGVAVLRVYSPLRKGDSIHIIGPKTNLPDLVNSLEIYHRKIATAYPGDNVALKVAGKVYRGDKIYVDTVRE